MCLSMDPARISVSRNRRGEGPNLGAGSVLRTPPPPNVRSLTESTNYLNYENPAKLFHSNQSTLASFDLGLGNDHNGHFHQFRIEPIIQHD